MDVKGDKFYGLEKEMSRDLRVQGDYENSEEASMLQIKKARKLYLVLLILFVSTIVFLLIFMPLMAAIQFKDVASLWNKYKPSDAPSSTRLTLSLKFPFLADFFFTNGNFPSAVYIIARDPNYYHAFMTVGTPLTNMQQLWANDQWGLHNNTPSKEQIATALKIICGTPWGMTVTDCQPVCPAGQGQYTSDYVSSMTSTGLTGVMIGSSIFPPIGSLVGGAIGAAIGWGTQYAAKKSSGSECQT